MAYGYYFFGKFMVYIYYGIIFSFDGIMYGNSTGTFCSNFWVDSTWLQFLSSLSFSDTFDFALPQLHIMKKNPGSCTTAYPRNNPETKMV